ncbi:MAG: TonB-dependent receptor [Lutibacter sp.]|nr:TonB-dependent receptor [Lutibacter sp.]
MKKLLIGTLTVFFCFIANGQNKSKTTTESVTISGKVIDEDTKQPLEYATIICTPIDGKNITGGITNQKGTFEISIPKGTYTISVEFISFKTKSFKNKEVIGNLNLGTIVLSTNSEALNEIEIIAEKSTVEIHLDKKIYNVGKDMTVKGGTASDVLDNVPSVTVDVEGTVSLRGSENVRILINGKPSGLIGIGGTNALKQLPADAIEKVEVITSPSARYDAEGTAGILNIILRKGKAQGFNSSYTVTAGNPDYFGGSANLNYRKEKVNYFSNIGYNYNKSPGNSKSDVTYNTPFNDLKRFNEKTIFDRKNNRFNAQFGAEYDITDKLSATGTILYRDSDENDISTNTRSNFNTSNVLTSTKYRIEDENEKSNALEYTFNLTKKFKKEGHLLTFDFRYGESTETNKNDIFDKNEVDFIDPNSLERSFTDEDSKDFLFKTDYVLPINENTQFEFGVNVDLNDLTTDYLLEEFDTSTNEYLNNTNFSNTLDFKQNIYATYAQFGQKVEKFSYLVGLRLENTDRTINLLQTNEFFNENFTQLFPTVNLGLEFNENENLTLGYSRRLRRPHSFYLNPFESRTSETYIRRGNIYLDPTYTNSFDLGYLKKWNKVTFNASTYYQHAINNTEWVDLEEYRQVDGVETLIIIRTPANLSSEDKFGFEFTANYSPFKWWKLTNSFNFFNISTDGDYNNVSYNSNDQSWFTRLESRINLPAKIDWQTSGMYVGPTESAFSKREGEFSINMAFSKDILKDKATIALNASDLLNSRKRSWTSYTDNTSSASKFQRRERQILLNFTYRFNQTKKVERNRNSGGGNEDMNF